MARFEILKEEKEVKIDKEIVDSYTVELTAENINDGLEVNDISEIQIYIVKESQTKEAVLSNAATHFENEIKKMYNIQ